MRRNVLLIDDDKDLQELVTFFLGQAGIPVTSAANGAKALTALKAHTYDLIILDISLPDFNGFDVLKSIRALDKSKDVPVIMLTGSCETDNILRVRNDVSDYILKPPKQADLVARVERILRDRSHVEEVVFRANDPLATGGFIAPLQLKAISKNGLVCSSAVSVEKGHVLRSLKLQLLDKLKLQNLKLLVSDCKKVADGDYEIFISFLGLSAKNQDIIQAWITEQIFKEQSKRARFS